MNLFGMVFEQFEIPPLEWSEHPGIGQERYLGTRDDPYIVIELTGPAEGPYAIMVHHRETDGHPIEDEQAYALRATALRIAFPDSPEIYFDWLNNVTSDSDLSHEFRRDNLQIILRKRRPYDGRGGTLVV